MEPLTPKQQKFYDFFTDKKNWKLKPPTLKECARYMGVRSDFAVWKMMLTIENKGYVLGGRKNSPRGSENSLAFIKKV